MFNLFNKKKRYFNKMLADIQRVIWNQEFKRFKALSVREQLRRQYDQTLDALNRVTAQAEAQKDNKEIQGTKASIEEQLKQVKGQLDDMDLRLNGEVPSEANPQGLIGITQELESSIEMREYIKAFVKHNV